MRIAAIQGSTLLDFPGRLACILFTQGCPYDCFYCHNRSLIALEGGDGAVDVEAFLTRRIGLLDGVVISGGEPTMHSDLPEFAGLIKGMGYAVKLDTNGCNPKMVVRLLEDNLLDYVALDVKATEADYRSVCGPNASWEAVEESLALLKASGIGFEVRTTVYPTMESDDLRSIAATISTVPLWRLNTYRVPDHYKSEDHERIHAPVMDGFAIQRWLDENRAFIKALEVTT